jgi:hypothetical protein
MMHRQQERLSVSLLEYGGETQGRLHIHIEGSLEPG